MLFPSPLTGQMTKASSLQLNGINLFPSLSPVKYIIKKDSKYCQPTFRCIIINASDALVHLHDPRLLEYNPFQTQLVGNNFDININELSRKIDADASKRRLIIVLIFLVKCFNKQLIIPSNIYM